MKTCEDLRAGLDAVIDDPLTPAAAEVEAHIDTCADCCGVVADLRRITAAAGMLEPMAPPEHVWLEIAGQIHAAAPSAPPRRAPAAVWQWAGLAAALLVVTTGVYLLGRVPVATPAPATTAAVRPEVAGTVEAVNEELDRAVEHYERAISELQALASNGATAIEPRAAAALTTEGQAIDRAIAESRSAITANPDNESARVSLFDALRRKVSVLQATVALITEMSQGDAAGAARAAENLGREL